MNRLTGKDLNADGSFEIQYVYDKGDSDQNNLGRLTKVMDPITTNFYSYDKYGNVVKENRRMFGTNYVTESAYDLVL